MTIGNYVKDYCERNNITIREFAEKCGINRSYLYILRRKEHDPSLETISKIAKVTGVSFEELARVIEYKISKHIVENGAHEIPLYTSLPFSPGNVAEYTSIYCDRIDLFFALRISDNDMSPLIFKNAVVIAEKISRQDVKNDNIVIASYEGKLYCRKYVYADKKTYLIPSNPKAETLVVNKIDIQDITIHGVVREVRFQIS